MFKSEAVSLASPFLSGGSTPAPPRTIREATARGPPGHCAWRILRPLGRVATWVSGKEAGLKTVGAGIRLLSTSGEVGRY